MDQDRDLPQGEAHAIKLTALALGELSKAEMDELLASSSDPSADCQAMAEAARLGECIRHVRRDEPYPARSSELRKLLAAKLDEADSRKLLTRHAARWPRQRPWLPLSLAASMLVVLGVFAALRSARRDEGPSVVAMHGDDAAARRDLQESASPQATHRESASGLQAAREEQARLGEVSASSAGDAGLQSAEGVVSTTAGNFPGMPAPAAPFSDAYQNGAAQRGQATGRFSKMRVGPGDRRGGAPTLDEAFYAGSGPMVKPVYTPAVPGGPPQPAAPAQPWHYTAGNARFGRGDVAAPRTAPAALAPNQGGLPGASSPEAPVSDFRGQPTPRILLEEKEGVAELDEGRLPVSSKLRTSELDPRMFEDAADRAGPAPAESYAVLSENPFVLVREAAVSTFSIDVDTASYANVRRLLNSGRLPPPAAVRIEEFVNYFSYDYPQPKDDVPFSVSMEVAGCPWNADHRLLRIGLKGREITNGQRPASNLTFLIDVSGSMDQPNKLPLVKEAMLILTEQLTENDRVSIVTYAGESGLVLPPTSGADKRKIETAVSSLVAGGSTNGGDGIRTAYAEAQAAFIKQGTNRVILATDGDFNVGVTDRGELVKLIEEQARGGVFFTALGFGADNLKDDTLESLADKGNGNYAYIDTLGEARKALVEQLSATLVTIAKDVKLQLEFNPAQVAAYRLIGYENRLLAQADFTDDRKDAGEIGAGHAVTALYELAPAGKSAKEADAGELKYQRPPQPLLKAAADSGEVLTLKLRYKAPAAETSRELEFVATDPGKRYGQAGTDFKFAAAVAAFGMLLRGSPHAGDANYDAVLELAGEGLGSDPQGYRTEFVELVRKAKALSAAP